MASSYVKVRGTTVRVLVVRSYVFEVFHRATKKAVDVHWVSTLPVVPYFIDHLSLSKASSVPSPSSNLSVSTYRMMQKEKWICTMYQRQPRGKGLRAYVDTPFGDHVGPCVQFDGAFAGHIPTISLDAAKDEKY